jgi:hypothetical protein
MMTKPRNTTGRRQIGNDYPGPLTRPLGTVAENTGWLTWAGRYGLSGVL